MKKLLEELKETWQYIPMQLKVIIVLLAVGFIFVVSWTCMAPSLEEIFASPMIEYY